jgi:hypothetical protein
MRHGKISAQLQREGASVPMVEDHNDTEESMPEYVQNMYESG